MSRDELPAAWRDALQSWREHDRARAPDFETLLVRPPSPLRPLRLRAPAWAAAGVLAASLVAWGIASLGESPDEMARQASWTGWQSPTQAWVARGSPLPDLGRWTSPTAALAAPLPDL